MPNIHFQINVMSTSHEVFIASLSEYMPKIRNSHQRINKLQTTTHHWPDPSNQIYTKARKCNGVRSAPAIFRRNLKRVLTNTLHQSQITQRGLVCIRELCDVRFSIDTF